MSDYMKVTIERETLMDNSEVYNVLFLGHKFAAPDLDDAIKFAQKIAEAVNEHTLEIAHVETTL